MNKLKLSVVVVCYNHERYLVKAMESIFLQKIDYEYEIIIADDYSTDGTKDIIKNYKKNYQDKITVLDNQENIGITKNFQKAFKACNGEYIAILEGDDYWTSPNKIAKQIKLLDEHREYSFCYHRFIGHNEETGHFFASRDIGDNRLITTLDLIYDNFIGNFSTCMYRKNIIDLLPESLFEMKVYDWMLNIVVSQYGVIGYLNELMSIYRQHDKGEWSSKSPQEKNNMLADCIKQYNAFLDYKYNEAFLYVAAKYAKKSSLINNFKYLFTIEGLSLCTPRIFKIIYSLVCPPIINIIINKMKNK
jgi:glycosyltransferase involved in cell wall biosynthesis